MYEIYKISKIPKAENAYEVFLSHDEKELYRHFYFEFDVFGDIASIQEINEKEKDFVNLKIDCFATIPFNHFTQISTDLAKMGLIESVFYNVLSVDKFNLAIKDDV